MSESTPEPEVTPEAQQPKPEAPPEAPKPKPAKAPEAPKAETPTPPWGSDEDFNPQRAWNLIQNIKADLSSVREDLTKNTQQVESWRAEAIRSKAEALITGRFIDTDTALALIGDLSEFSTESGVDTEKLAGRLDQLAQDKPFLLAPPPHQGFTPNRGQGQSGTGPMPLDAQIQAAQERGDVKQSIALKQQKFYQTQ